jgi:hypothetical protein
LRHTSELFYDLVEHFYSALLTFEEQRDEYEHAVLSLAAREGVHRSQLRLPANEVARLLDFKVLSRLRDKFLRPLRECSRQLFGGSDRDIFAIMIADIFHLVSILKEEEFRVSHYAVLYERMENAADREFILDSVHHDFPLLLSQTHNLFLQARERLHTHLPAFADDPVVLRSLHLFGRSYLDIVYAEEGGMEGFWWKMFPDHGPFEANLTIARSFHRGGFTSEALVAAHRARALADGERRVPTSLVTELEQLEALLAESSGAGATSS